MPVGTELDLSRLRQFIELARVGHYGRAAAELGIPQPQLSRAMRRFEQEIGVGLLQRHSRGVATTEAGRNVAEVGESILSMAKTIYMFGKDARPDNEMTIGLPPRLGPSLTGAILEKVRRRWPEIHVRFIEASATALESHALAGRVQVSLLHDFSDIDDLIATPLLDEELVLAFSPAWSTSFPIPSLRLRDLSKLPLILPTVSYSDRRLVLKAEARHGLHLQPVLEIDSPLTLRALVNAGVGATITGGPSLHEDLLKGTLASHPIADPILRTRLNVVTSRHCAEGIAPELVKIVGECVLFLVENGRWPNATIVSKY